MSNAGYLKMFVIRGYLRSLEVNKGQMEVKNQKLKKSTLWVLMERSSIVEINYLTFFVIRGHWRSMEVNKGQMEVKIKN